jgi:hypothetical protein
VSQYRDPLAGLISQVATKRAALEDRVRRLSPAAASMLPERLTRVFAELITTATAPAEDLVTLSSAEAALDALLDAYDEALALAPGLCACPDDVADFDEPAQPRPWLIEERALLAFRRSAEARLAAITRGASTLVRWGDRGYLARMNIGGVPLVYTGEYSTRDGTVDFADSKLRTSVPRALPYLELRREHAFHTMGRILGLANEEEVGDAIFDQTFWVHGSHATATLLVSAVRRALVMMVRENPVLRVADGLAELSWGGWGSTLTRDETGILPDAAIAVVVELRRALEPREPG